MQNRAYFLVAFSLPKLVFSFLYQFISGIKKFGKYRFKKYIDVVFTEGHTKGIYKTDGRSAENPTINYGTAGMLHGKKYMLTTSWNTPKEAFTLPAEFFNQHSVDEGPLFGFHRMNAFTGMQPLQSIHFHEIEKNANVENDLKVHQNHLTQLFLN